MTEPTPLSCARPSVASKQHSSLETPRRWSSCWTIGAPLGQTASVITPKESTDAAWSGTSTTRTYNS